MKKSKILQNEINNAIEKFKLLTENERIEVYKISVDILEKSTKLPIKEFINDHYYKSYKQSLSNHKPHFENELRSLLENKDNTYTDNNFSLIKGSLLMLSPEKYTNR